jgi:asparagine synthase (glutamine-hydrolysing)
VHLRADVPVGAYLSGGIDSSLVAMQGAREGDGNFCGFHGFFSWGPEFDESRYAQAVADAGGFPLHITDITAGDFIENISQVIYHLDCPVAGPGSFPQYIVSRMAARHRKVVFGGQGGDEVFGGYTRYLIAYLEQVIKGAIDGTMSDGNFVVTYESIIPNLSCLRNYKPMLKEFWRDGLFDSMDRRYFRLINRASHLGSVIRWDQLPGDGAFERFQKVFYAKNVGKQSYFDLMTHFDFKTLLPALLQVEDRMSMAHGLESRVPLLDHELVEFAATVPADVKFRNGDMKHLLKETARSVLPKVVLDRTDKMGFPTPLNEWLAGPARDFLMDTLSGSAALNRDFVDNAQVARMIDSESKIGRNLWGLLCLELWQTRFHDKHGWFVEHLNPDHPAQKLPHQPPVIL